MNFKHLITLLILLTLASPNGHKVLFASAIQNHTLKTALTQEVSLKEIRKRVKVLVGDHLGVKPKKIKDHAKLKDLGADPLDEIEVLMAIEKTFDVLISDEMGIKITQVNHYVDFLYKALNGLVLYNNNNLSGDRVFMGNDWTPVYPAEKHVISGGLTSLFIPQGYKVELYDEVEFKGEILTIKTPESDVEIKNLDQITLSNYIHSSDDTSAWNNRCGSLKIEKLK